MVSSEIVWDGPAREAAPDLASNLLMQIKQTERIVGSKEKTVFVDPNPIRVREMLDKNGNVIDPRTKQIIRRVGEDENPK